MGNWPVYKAAPSLEGCELCLGAQCVQLFVTLWTITCQAPLSMEFSRQKYWIGLPFPSPRDLPTPRIKPGSPASQKDSLPCNSPGKPVYVNTKLLIYLSFFFSFGNSKFVFYVCGSISVSGFKFMYQIFFRFHI